MEEIENENHERLTNEVVSRYISYGDMRPSLSICGYKVVKCTTCLRNATIAFVSSSISFATAGYLGWSVQEEDRLGLRCYYEDKDAHMEALSCINRFYIIYGSIASTLVVLGGMGVMRTVTSAISGFSKQVSFSPPEGKGICNRCFIAEECGHIKIPKRAQIGGTKATSSVISDEPSVVSKAEYHVMTVLSGKSSKAQSIV